VEFMSWCVCDEERQLNAAMLQNGHYDGRLMLELAEQIMEQTCKQVASVKCDLCGEEKLVDIVAFGD